MVLALSYLQKIRLLTATSLLAVAGWVAPSPLDVDGPASKVDWFCGASWCVSQLQDQPVAAFDLMGDRVKHKVATILVSDLYQHSRALDLDVAVVLSSYTPPACNDGDADTTNNCGPNDSGDAGTRLSV